MADFIPAYEAMIVAEGGYTLHQHPADMGGSTYAGIARNKNPNWEGWALLDRGETPPTAMVRDFYRKGWWMPIMGDAIANQAVANDIFGFAVNSSAPQRPRTAIVLVQACCGATPDGVFGPRTLAAVNAMDAELFMLRFAIAKIARYRDICVRNKSQRVFLVGWINRVLGSLK